MSSLRIFPAYAILIMGIFFMAVATSAAPKTSLTPSVAAVKSSSRSTQKVGASAGRSTLEGERVNAPLSTCTWTGASGSDWMETSNWDCGHEPASSDVVIINDTGGIDPVLYSQAPLSGFFSSVTINAGAKLTVFGPDPMNPLSDGVLKDGGDFFLNGGTLQLGDSGAPGGTVTVGFGNNLLYSSGSTLTIFSGALNIAGRLSPSSAPTDTITYNQSGGTVTVAIDSSADATFGAFSIPASGSTFQMSGTAMIIQREPTAVAQDYVNLAATSNLVTSGTLQFGDGDTTSVNPHYAINSSAPVFNLTLSSISGLRVNIRDNTLPVLGTLSIQSGAQLDDNDDVPKGATIGGDWINDGTFTSQDVPGGDGLITFSGGATQNISGSSPTTFHDLTINSSGVVLGQTITVNSTLTLTSGNVTTNSNTVVIGSSGAVSRTSGHIIGNLQKSYSAPASKTFEVGTANGYSPVDVNVTAGSGDFTVKATGAPQPNIVSPTHALQRYWTLTAVGMTADLMFQYLDPPDVPGTANENNFVIFKYDGSFSMPGGSVNTGANTASINGVSSFSDWTLAEPLAPTASTATISGQITTADGRPVGGVTLGLSGSESQRTVTDGHGQYHFDNVGADGFYTVTPELVNYSFAPASRSFSLSGNKTDAVFTGTTVAQTENPVNVTDFFVRQEYLDFLGREPDHAGWLFWTNQLARCGADETCVRQRRIDISAAFFSSEEFQQSGNYVYRLYRAALGRQLTYAEFMDDHTKVVGGADLAARRKQFADAFVQRADFVAKYRNAASAEAFVDSLSQTARQDVNLELLDQRDQLIAQYNNGMDLNLSRSAVLQAVAEGTEFKSLVHNQSFVLMEYFGYLRRDIDRSGFEFWVSILNRDAENYRGMVCSFITSAEYQRRFSSVVTRNNTECGR